MFKLFLEKKQHKAKQSILVISKQYIPLFCILLVYFALLPFNPMISRMQERDAISKNVQNTEVETSKVEYLEEVKVEPKQDVVGDNTDYKTQFIEANYEDKQLHKEFLFEYYPLNL